MLNGQFILDNENPVKYLDTIGSWIIVETNHLSSLNGFVSIHKRGENYLRYMMFSDGSESHMKLKKRTDTRYDVIGKDYLVIKSDGRLEFWDKEGYLLTRDTIDS